MVNRHYRNTYIETLNISQDATEFSTTRISVRHSFAPVPIAVLLFSPFLYVTASVVLEDHPSDPCSLRVTLSCCRTTPRFFVCGDTDKRIGGGINHPCQSTIYQFQLLGQARRTAAHVVRIQRASTGAGIQVPHKMTGRGDNHTILRFSLLMNPLSSMAPRFSDKACLLRRAHSSPSPFVSCVCGFHLFHDGCILLSPSLHVTVLR
ncbi:hypothetical protein GE09DRAFT_166448 [Coniochaeta sp. 2T2.1]|nr:hypothetical protein GE09DRAFT_166448 [Coniochaeta sp. 2T2.1]